MELNCGKPFSKSRRIADEEEEEKRILSQEGLISPPKKVNMCGSSIFCSSPNQQRICSRVIKPTIMEEELPKKFETSNSFSNQRYGESSQRFAHSVINEGEILLPLNDKKEMEIENRIQFNVSSSKADSIPESLKICKANEILEEKQVLSSCYEFPRTQNNAERSVLYTIRKNQNPPQTSYSKEEPHMVLTVSRKNTEATEYIVTAKGMVNSNRNTDHDDILIGRQQAGEGIIPNDICLLHSDRAISRIHCKLITKFGFKVQREIPENFFTFLMVSNSRIGRNSPARRLPSSLFRHIFSFIKEPTKFWIADMGSAFGTYIRIGSSKGSLLEESQSYLIGADTSLNIIQINNQISNPSETRNEDLLQWLCIEKATKNCQVHGLNQSEQALLESMVSEYKTMTTENIFGCLKSCHLSHQNLQSPRPILKMEISNGGAHCVSNNIFIGGFKNVFTIGRQQTCDINVHREAISRIQCRVLFEDGNWKIADGQFQKDSANGTWISLNDIRARRQRSESKPREIGDLTEIKISDTIIRCKIYNNK